MFVLISEIGCFIKEGRRQEAEGRRFNFRRGFKPFLKWEPPNFDLVGVLNPCSLRSPEALRHSSSAFCRRTSAFPDKWLISCLTISLVVNYPCVASLEADMQLSITVAIFACEYNDFTSQ